MYLPAKSVSSIQSFLILLKQEAQKQEERLGGGWGCVQNPRSQVASASLPGGQLNQTILQEVAMDLGQLCSSVGTVAFWLVATDRDNDRLTYGISGINANYFSVVSDTGEVKLVSSLDYEVKDGAVGKAWRGARQARPLEPEFWEHGWIAH